MTNSNREFTLQLKPLDAAGATVEYDYSTVGYVTTDPAAATTGGFVEGRLRVAGIIERHMFAEGKLRGPIALPDAACVLSNEDGALDFLRDLAFDRIEMPVNEIDPVTFVAISLYPYTTLVAEQPLIGEEDVTFSMHDPRHYLNRPYTSVNYAGTNAGSPLSGIEGVADDLEGQTKPMVIGKVFNITPYLVNTDRLIYQVSGVDSAAFAPGGAAAGFNANWSLTVYDSRSVLTQGANYASQADMEANVPSPGQFRVWAAGGCFRLGTQPIGRVTCDVENPPNGAATYGIEEVVGKLLALSAGSTRLAGQVNGVYTSTVDRKCGIYLENGQLVLDAISEVLDSINGTIIWSQPPNAGEIVNQERICILQLQRPADTNFINAFGPGTGSYLIVDEGDLIEPMVPLIPQEDHRGLPVWRVHVGYKKNYTVMTPDECAGDVGLSDLNFVQRQFRYVKDSDTSVLTQWPNAIEITVNSLFTAKADAQAEATRLLTILKARRDMFRISLSGDSIRALTANPRKFVPGWQVRLTHSRFGLTGSKDFLILSAKDNLDEDRVEMVIWG